MLAGQIETVVVGFVQTLCKPFRLVDTTVGGLTEITVRDTGDPEEAARGSHTPGRGYGFRRGRYAACSEKADNGQPNRDAVSVGSFLPSVPGLPGQMSGGAV